MKYVVDIETNGFLEVCTELFCLVAINVDTKEEHVFRPGDNTWMELLDNAKALIAHNGIGFDFPALKKLTGWVPKCPIQDTMIMSQLQKYNRPGMHSLKNLAKLAGGTQKQEYSAGFDVFSEEMLEYCIDDVRANVDVYLKLIEEFKFVNKKTDGKFKQAMRLEHDFAMMSAQMAEDGWLIDIPKVQGLLSKIELEMASIELEVEPKLEDRVIIIDKEPRSVKFLKDGRMDRVSRLYFGVDRWHDGLPKSYTRQRTATSDLGNNEQVIGLLYQEGWVPTEYNWKKDGFNWIKGTPKLSEDSFDSIRGDLGRLVARWRILRSRRGFCNGMLEGHKDGRMHCNQFTLGTHTSRARHKGIVNVPGAYAVLGKEIRSSFISKPGWSIVGADSSGNQLRGFAYYLGNASYTSQVLDGDIHQHNADILGVDRPVAKSFIYAFLFGAGDKKLGSVVGGDAKDGKRLKKKFFEAIPQYPALIQSLSNQWENNGGYVFGLDGRRVFCEQRKALNNLMQAYEAVTCRSAYVMMWEELKRLNIPHEINILYHDEIEFSVPNEYAEQCSQMAVKCFEEAPKAYGVDIMSGDARIGRNWFDVH